MMVIMVVMSTLSVCSRRCISTGVSVGRSSKLAPGGGGSGPAGFPAEVGSEAFLAWAFPLLPPPPLTAGSKGDTPSPPTSAHPRRGAWLPERRTRQRAARQRTPGWPPAPRPLEQ